VSPVGRRRTVAYLRDRLGYSERRICRAIGQARSSQRYTHRVPDDEKFLIEEMHRLAVQGPRLGYRRIAALLGKDGWRVNIKRVHRLWRAEGLQIRGKVCKRRRLGDSDNACHRRKPLHKDHVWGCDFVSDRTEGGGRLRLLTVLDEYTRECLTIQVRRRFTGQDVVQSLSGLFAIRGRPKYLRSDNGPKFASKAVKKWLKKRKVGTLFIEPGSPRENGYMKSFNGKLRDECLNGELFLRLAESRYVLGRWRMDYNHHGPHSRLEWMTPAAFAASWPGMGRPCVPPGSATPGPQEHTASAFA